MPQVPDCRCFKKELEQRKNAIDKKKGQEEGWKIDDFL